MGKLNGNLEKYQYCIKAQDFCDDNSLCLITIQDVNTKEILHIPIAELIQNFEMLGKFSPRDIFVVAYLFAEDQIWKTQKWLQTQRNIT